MSTTYAGGIERSILSSTDATPIKITTSANHGFTTGDQVLVVGHLVNTNANGLWNIIVTSPTQFTLNNSVGTGAGAGGATGTVFDDSFPASLTIPSDGDDLDASSVDVALEALADRTTFLERRLQPMGLVEIATAHSDSSHTGPSTAGPTTFASFTGNIVSPTINTSTGDTVVVRVSGWTTQASTVLVGLQLQASRNGGAYSAMSSTCIVQNGVGVATEAIPFAVEGVQTIGSNPGYYVFQLMGGGAATWTIEGYSMVVEHYRPQS